MDSLNSFDDFNLDELDDLDPSDGASASAVPRRIVIVLWLVAAGLLLALLPISLISKMLVQDAEAVALEAQQAEDVLLVPPTPRAEIQPLLSTLQAVQDELKAFDAAAAPVGGERIYWPDIVAAVRSYDTRGACPDQL